MVDGTLYVGSDDGFLYALDADGDGSSEDSRVRLGTLGHHDEWAETAAALDESPSRDSAETGDAAGGADEVGQNDPETSDDDAEGVDEEDDSTDGLPGFGVVTALTALGGTGYVLRRRIAHDEPRRVDRDDGR